METLRVIDPDIKNAEFRRFVDSKVLITRTDKQRLLLAGGANRSFVDGSTPTDYDLFIIGIDASNEMKFDVLNSMDALGERIFTCPEGLLHTWKTLFGKVQLITPQVYKTVHHLFDTFDFTLCQAAYMQSLSGGTLFYTQAFWDDVSSKTLRLLNVSYPLATMNRIYKYKGYGFKVGKAQEEFIAQVYEREFNDESLYRHYID